MLARRPPICASGSYHFRALEDDEELAAATALSDAAHEFDGTPAAFADAFWSGALKCDGSSPEA